MRIRLALLVLLPGATLIGAPQPSSTHAFLRDRFQVAPRDIAALARREPVVRTLDVEDGREVATLGLIRLGVPASFYLQQLRDIVALKKQSSAVLQIGRFSEPARVDDLAALTLDGDDIDRLRKCRPRDCGVQLPEAAIRRFQAITWGAPDAPNAATRLMREVLVELVNSYRESGQAALPTYADADRPVSVAGEFNAMIDAKPAVLRQIPELHRHLTEFPRGGGAVEDVFYWSKEKMGPASIVGVTHLAIVGIENGGAVTAAIASRQIYAAHYFDASLGVTLLLQDRPEDTNCVLVYVNRSRIDLLKGFLSAVKRPVVRSRVRGATSTHLLEARTLSEQRYARELR